MRLSIPKISALTTLALAGLAVPSAKALSAVADDVFLGFHQSGNTSTDYVIDIGQASIYRNTTVPITLNLTGLDTDMATAFGNPAGNANWKSSGTILWGLVATPGLGPIGSDPANLLYVSEPTGFTPLANTAQSGMTNNINTFKNYWNTLSAGAVNQSVPGIGTVVGAVGNPGNASSWSHWLSVNWQNGNNVGTPETSLTSSFSLFRLPQTLANADQSGVTNEGAFTFNIGPGATLSSITFIPVVPEPTTASLLCVALVSLAARRHRRSVPAR